ncbi:MAG: hypothetical protein OXU75_00405 [Deltaproteobacteria bacterium]|nr:hypothetical protein [Deltaproteobacteria bacterium]
MGRKVSKAILEQHELEDYQVAYWDTLSDDQQENYFSRAFYESRNAVYYENMYGKLGQRGRRGRGSVLADAVEKAYQDSPEYKAKVAKINAERKAAYDNERLTCIECGKEHPRQKGVQFGGAESMCLPCAIAHSKPGTPIGDMYREEWERVRGIPENPPELGTDRPIRPSE